MGSLAGSKLALTGLALALLVAMVGLVGCDQEATPAPSSTPETYTVQMLIEVAPDDVRWFPDVQMPRGYDAYELMELVTEGDLESTWYPAFRAHFVESIFGVKNEGSSHWLTFVWNVGSEEWEPLPVGADLFSVKDGHALAWLYADTSQEAMASPSQNP